MTGPSRALDSFDSFWDRSYRDGSYLEHWDPPGVPGELAGLMAAGLAPMGTAVLDVGCGAGLEAVWLAERGCSVIGVDSSREALARADERAAAAEVGVDWRLGSVYALPVADASIGLALDRGCLHGIDREDRPDYAAEIARVLRPGGRLLLRGAAEDDEEQGLVGIAGPEVDRLFPPGRFGRGPVVPVELEARAGNLRAHLVLIEKRS
ncbi:MAG: class I SAM-dependent methyltransferase [Acidobacteriota bacterium]|jgi:SAM-dependent methyltransferase